MKPEIIHRDELHGKLEQGAVVVTGNARLAMALQQEFLQRAVDSGQLVWESPSIKPWNSWLRQTWDEAVFDGLIDSPDLLLTDEQEQLVWETVIESSATPILRKEATAKKASEAWRELIDWQVKRDQVDFDTNEDTQAFQSWSDEFERRCNKHGWLPTARMAEQLAECFGHDTGYSFSSEIILTGFDELTPLQQLLVEAICNNNGSINWLEVSPTDGQCSTAVSLACADSNDEIDTVARWISKCLRGKADGRIGIVVPDLSGCRSSLIRSLTELLVPGNLLADGDEPLPWNLSLGLPLKRYPVIETAFKVLELAGGDFPLEEASPLLCSPYLAGAIDEIGSRALLDRRLRESGEMKLRMKTLCWLAGDNEYPWHSPRLARSVCELHELTEKIPGSANSADWVKWFAQILTCMGWAKDRIYNAEEYQALEAWNKLLARFSGLQAVSGRLSYSRALGLLKQLAQSQIFQPRTESTPVQVLGLYEAIGQQFDALWVMDLHDGNWPASPQPNPFIPLALQRQREMPHADQSRELLVAQRITARLLSSASDVVMSYPLRKGEEPLRISPLIRHLPEGDKNGLTLFDEKTWSEVLLQSGREELLHNDNAPALLQQNVSGGSGIFKYQSLCPFRAFAQYRLSATALETPQVGLDAMKRGQLFHKILELFWLDVRNLKSLLLMSVDELQQKLDEVIDQAINKMAEKHPDVFTPRFRQIESFRLKQLAQQWLELEKQRADFTVVNFEKEVRQDINGINVHLWIDRVDELADGSKVVIDYKTGTVSPSQWFGERPEEPQLPLYSAVEGEGISAVLYGQLKAADMKFSGVVADDTLIPNLPPPRNAQLKEITEQWPQVLHDWKLTINQLAADFRNGRAEVDPKKPDTCDTSYCELSGLCRIDELIVAAGEDE